MKRNCCDQVKTSSSCGGVVAVAPPFEMRNGFQSVVDGDLLIGIPAHRYGREYADPYTIGHGVGPVPGGYGVRRRIGEAVANKEEKKWMPN